MVKGKFENYVTPDGTSATTKAEFTATENGAPVSMESNEVTVTSRASTEPWSIEIKKIAQIAEPFRGSDVHYEISVKPIGDGNGMLDIINIVVTARLEDGAVFVSAGSGGTAGPANTVVWNLGDNLRNAKTLKLVVNYPGSMTATEATSTAEMNFKPLGGTPTTKFVPMTHGFAIGPEDVRLMICITR